MAVPRVSILDYRLTEEGPTIAELVDAVQNGVETTMQDWNLQVGQPEFTNTLVRGLQAWVRSTEPAARGYGSRQNRPRTTSRDDPWRNTGRRSTASQNVPPWRDVRNDATNTSGTFGRQGADVLGVWEGEDFVDVSSPFLHNLSLIHISEPTRPY